MKSSPGAKAFSLPYLFPTALTKCVLLYIKLKKFIKMYTDFHSNETGLATVSVSLQFPAASYVAIEKIHPSKKKKIKKLYGT